MRKIPFAGIELTSQRVRGLRGTSELPGRPATCVSERSLNMEDDNARIAAMQAEFQETVAKLRADLTARL